MEKVKAFFSSERGDSNMVSIIVIIVIVLMIAVIFKDGIVAAANNIMKALSDWGKTGGKQKPK